MQVIALLAPLMCAFGAALLLAALVWRRGIARTLACFLTASAFACAGAYFLWRTEWFDVWRHGVPPLTYLVGYVPYLMAFGAGGWLVGAALVSIIESRRGIVAPGRLR